MEFDEEFSSRILLLLLRQRRTSLHRQLDTKLSQDRARLGHCTGEKVNSEGRRLMCQVEQVFLVPRHFTGDRENG